MARLIGIFADAPLTLAHAVTRAPAIDAAPSQDGRWGCAYAQDGKALVKRQPLRPGRTLSAVLGATRSQAAVVRRWGADEGDLAPRRFGPWMWGWEGTLAADAGELAAAAKALPDSLRRSLRSLSAEGLLFHQILAALKALRVKLAYWGPPVEPVVDAIQQVLVSWRARFGRIDGRFVLATERRAFAAALGGPLGVGCWRTAADGLEAVDESDAGVWIFADDAGPHARPLESGTILALDGVQARRYDLTRGAWR